MARIRLNRAQIVSTSVRLATPLVFRTGLQVQAGAKVLVPKGDHLSGSGHPKRGQRLGPSIFSDFQSSPQHLRMKIGSREDHAATVHQGSAAHMIRSASGKALKFRWERGDFLVATRAGRRRGNRRTGQFHYFLRVRHPGNKRPVRYLTTPLAMFGRANGFRVTTVAVGRGRLP